MHSFAPNDLLFNNMSHNSSVIFKVSPTFCYVTKPKSADHVSISGAKVLHKKFTMEKKVACHSSYAELANDTVQFVVAVP